MRFRAWHGLGVVEEGEGGGGGDTQVKEREKSVRFVWAHVAAQPLDNSFRRSSIVGGYFGGWRRVRGNQAVCSPMRCCLPSTPEDGHLGEHETRDVLRG